MRPATRRTAAAADLERFEPELVLKRGRKVDEIERVEVPEWVKQTVRIRPLAARDFAVPGPVDRRA